MLLAVGATLAGAATPPRRDGGRRARTIEQACTAVQPELETAYRIRRRYVHYITAVRLASNGTHAWHITDVWWLEPSQGISNVCAVATMVDHIRKGNAVRVGGPSGPVAVQVVDASPPYLRTQADRTVADNLLSLPRF